MKKWILVLVATASFIGMAGCHASGDVGDNGAGAGVEVGH